MHKICKRFICLHSVCGKRDLGLLGSEELRKNPRSGTTAQRLLTAWVVHAATYDILTRRFQYCFMSLILSKPYIKQQKQRHQKQL